MTTAKAKKAKTSTKKTSTKKKATKKKSRKSTKSTKKLPAKKTSAKETRNKSKKRTATKRKSIKLTVKVRPAQRRPAPAPKLSRFATDLLEEWRRLGLPITGANVVVAVSGGADSTSLLLALDELIKRKSLALELVVAHLDHGLRAASVNDAQWVKNLANQLGYGAVTRRVDLTRAGLAKENLEQAARDARYEFLHKTAKSRNSNWVVTGHTLDDQAETILLRLLRGSGAEGLSGSPAIRELQEYSKVQLVRPLQRWARRDETEEYCRARKVEFRLDEMNADETFSRVRVRNQLLPLMKSFNNRIVEALSRTAELLGQDATALAAEAARILASITDDGELEPQTGAPSLRVDVLLQVPEAIRRRVLRQWIQGARGDLRRVEMVHLVAVENLLEGEKGGRIAELPGGMTVTRQRGKLEIAGKNKLKKA